MGRARRPPAPLSVGAKKKSSSGAARAQEPAARWRPARPDEDEHIVALCLALNAEDPGPRPVSAQQIRRTLATLASEPWRGSAIVLDVGGAVSGYALLISFWSNEIGGEICTVDELYVVPAKRGRGHASALLSALGEGRGPWPKPPVAITLEVTPANRRAFSLYERLGFTPSNGTMRRLVTRSD